MSVIQKIRDKYARWAVIAIALSLLGFILMDAFAGRTGLFSNSNDNAVGSINGRTIDAVTFTKKVSAQEAADQQQQMQGGEERRQQLVNGLWEQEVNDVVMSEEYAKLGLTVTSKEMDDVLYGEDAPQDIKQNFTDEKTGVFNRVAAQQAVNAKLKSGSAQEVEQLNSYINYLKGQRLLNKYLALLNNSVYFPKWYLEKKNLDNGMMGNISYVTIPYTNIPDSSVKVTDQEITDYMKAHEEQFTQEKETRSVSYVLFGAYPSHDDTLTALKQINDAKPGLAETTNPSAFVQQQGNALPYFDAYVSKNAIQVPAKDSVLALPKGGIYGPYQDGNNFVLAKMIDTKMLPDSVECRHILITTTNGQGQQILSDSAAKARIDSISKAIAGGASFDSLETKYSVDTKAHETKGVMTFSSTQIQSENFAKEFGQFILFDGQTGSKKVVKTQYGYHYIEILNQKNVGPHYKVAYVGKPVLASSETDNNANSQASTFAAESQNLKSFNENYDKNLRPKGLNKLAANDLTDMDFTINGITGSSRNFIKSVFAADKGDVVGPERVGDNYIVAIVTDVNKPGMMSVSNARMMVEPLLRNQKKADLLIKQIGKYSSLQEVATKFNQQVLAADSLKMEGSNKVLGFEPKVIGAAFNPANKGKVVPEPIPGTQGVYVIQVNSTTTVPVDTNLELQAKTMEMQQRQAMMYNSPIQALRKTAKIKDNRAKFY
jgi:peptidyl-prolyl cis-trans isomerase D